MKNAMEFLRRNLPQSDLDCYEETLFQQFAAHALMLRETAPWCKALEQELFDHYVLFPRVNDEDLSFHRKLFYDALWPRIAPLESMEKRILEVNRWCGQMANYQMQDDRTASPLTVFRNGSGRCGEESAFLVAALRSVGIPARQVYAPRWAHCDDNHAWVEAWCDGRWRFLGACEPEPVLDRGWFNTPASRALLVHSRIFGKSGAECHGQLISREGGVSWYNQTDRYALTRQYRFRVLQDGSPATGAKIHIQVLNESNFHTIATLTADEQGCAEIRMGLGGFHILAVRDGLWAEADCGGEETVLQLCPIPKETTPWCCFDVHAPESSKRNESVLDALQKQRRAADREQCALAREMREESFHCGTDLLALARGNGAVIAQFLEADGDPKREALLRSLSHKDLRDVTVEVLNDHLHHTPDRGGIPEDIYDRYVLCPRIGQELLRPWRQELRRQNFPKGPEALWKFLTQRISTDVDCVYSNLTWTPLESWNTGRCDEKSLRLLFVAALRSFGIPARLRPLDGTPEYWKEGSFHTVEPEKSGTLSLTCEELPAYRQSWSLSRWVGDGWQLMSLDSASREIPLPVCLYRLITTQRMPNGSQYATMRQVMVHPGETVCTDLLLRSFTLADMLGSQELPEMSGETLGGARIPLLTEGPGLLLWLEEGAEPTEHLLAELMEQQSVLEKLPLAVSVLLRSREGLRHAALARLLEQWPGIRVLLDDWHFDLEMTARCLTCDPDTPPLAVVCDGGGRAVFGASGYRVGLGKLLADIARHLCE